MWKIITAVLKLIAPLGIQDDPKAQQAWRWAVFGMLMVLMVCFWLAMLYATGKVLGSSGYVQHSELITLATTVAKKAEASDLSTVTSAMAKVSSSVDFLTKESIEGSIRAKLSTACTTQDRAFKSELNTEIQGLEDRYFSLTGQGYRQPTCDEL